MPRNNVRIDHIIGLIVGMAIGWLLLGLNAHAADAAYCKRYASAATNDLLTKLATAPVQNWIHDRLESTCGNAETAEPPLPRSVDEALRIILPSDKSDLQCIGTVPATDPSKAVAKLTPATARPPPSHPSPILRVAAASSRDQPLCAAHKMRTVWNGLSWRCLK